VRRLTTLRSPLLLTALLVGVAGCGDDGFNPFEPSQPLSPADRTEEFSGTVGLEDSAVHPFPVPSRSNISVTLVTVGPLATLSVGLGVGTWNGEVCSLIGADNNARQSTALSGQVEPGNYCAAIYDNGNFTEPVTYLIRVQRPSQ
jgi:hypothetical protein